MAMRERDLLLAHRVIRGKSDGRPVASRAAGVISQWPCGSASRTAARAVAAEAAGHEWLCREARMLEH
jgi:hypothetical protein